MTYYTYMFDLVIGVVGAAIIFIPPFAIYVWIYLTYDKQTTWRSVRRVVNLGWYGSMPPALYRIRLVYTAFVEFAFGAMLAFMDYLAEFPRIELIENDYPFLVIRGLYLLCFGAMIHDLWKLYRRSKKNDFSN